MKRILLLLAAMAVVASASLMSGMVFARIMAADPPAVTEVREIDVQRFPLVAPTSRTGYFDLAIVGDSVRLLAPGAKLGVVTGASVDSMRPVAGNGTKLLYVPVHESAVVVGDLIVTGPALLCHAGLQMHQVWKVASDAEGWYALTWGVANGQADLCPVRASDLKGRVVALLY